MLSGYEPLIDILEKCTQVTYPSVNYYTEHRDTNIIFHVSLIES